MKILENIREFSRVVGEIMDHTSNDSLNEVLGNTIWSLNNYLKNNEEIILKYASTQESLTLKVKDSKLEQLKELSNTKPDQLMMELIGMFEFNIVSLGYTSYILKEGLSGVLNEMTLQSRYLFDANLLSLDIIYENVDGSILSGNAVKYMDISLLPRRIITEAINSHSDKNNISDEGIILLDKDYLECVHEGYYHDVFDDPQITIFQRMSYKDIVAFKLNFSGRDSVLVYPKWIGDSDYKNEGLKIVQFEGNVAIIWTDKEDFKESKPYKSFLELKDFYSK